MAECATCNRKINRAQGAINCGNKLCGRVFHPECVNLAEGTGTPPLEWRCSFCQDAAKAQEVPADINETLSSILKEMKIMRSEIGDVKTSIQFTSDQYDALMLEVRELTKIKKENSIKIEQLEIENRELKKEMGKFQNKLNDLEQYGRRNNVEVHGIDEKEGEDVTKLIIELGANLNFKAEELKGQIEAAHRLKPKKVDNKPRTRPAPIIVRFLSRVTQENWMAKHKTGLASFNIIEGGSQTDIYISENLTAENRHLAYLARKAGRELRFKYVWTKYGTVFMRKDEKSRVLKIDSEEDIPKSN